MQVDCTQVHVDEDGRVVCKLVVKNHTSDADTINHIHMAGTESNSEGGVCFLESIPQLDVALPPGGVWEGTFTWSADASNKVIRLGKAMVLVEFAHAKPVGNAFTLADVQDEKGASSNFQKLVQKVGWPLISLAILFGILAMTRTFEHQQQKEEIARTLENQYSGPSYPDGPYYSARAMVWREFYHQYVTDDMDAESRAAAVERLRALINDLFKRTEAQRSGQQKKNSAITGLVHGGGASTEDNRDSTALIDASSNGDIDAVKRLLDQGADANDKNNDGVTALMVASEAGHADIVNLLIDQGADVNATTNNGVTALMIASEAGHKDIVKLLLDQGANVDVKDNGGATASKHAFQAGHADIAKLLILQP